MHAPPATFVGPVPLTTFIGRDAELARLRERIAGGARLVTLFGPAGIGKTRLALRYAELHGGPATCFCELASASSLEDVCRLVAGSMNVPLRGGGGAEELVDQIVRTLTGDAELTVVIDNCEQVAGQVALLLSRWCPVAPSTRFLATSRELLGVAGEAAFEVGPLGLPRDGADSQAEAVRLFVDRARLIRDDYALGPSEASAVAALVRHLDGLPLAIELAAGWSDVHRADALLARLPQRLDELSNRARTAVDRQRTLRGAIDASWLLLQPWEQAALAECAVFRGGFSLESAEAVLDLSSHPSAPTVAQVIASLRAKSLVRAFQPPKVASSPRRFALYESIRVYAEEKLGVAGRRPFVEARHATHFGAVAAAALELGVTNVTEREQILWLDLENLLAVHAHALAGSATLGIAATIALALERPLLTRWLVRSLSALLEGVLGHGHVGSLDGEVVALTHVARTRVRSFELVATRTEIEEALSLSLQAGSRLAEGRALGNLAWLDYYQGAGTAAPSAERALDVLTQVGDGTSAAEIRILLGYTEHALGNEERARECAEQAIATARAVGDITVQGEALMAISYFFMAFGELDHALATAIQAEGLGRQTGNSALEGGAAILAAQSLQEQGRFAEARVHYERALDIYRSRYQHDPAMGRLLGYMGTLEHELGHGANADAYYREALILVRRSNFRACEAVFGAALGALEAAADWPEEAGRLLDEAEHRVAEQAGKGFVEVVQLHRGHIDLSRARAPERDGDGAANRARARERLASVDAKYPSEDVRFARRLLERAIRADAATPLVIGAQASWLTLPSGERHVVPQKPMRYLLLALAEQHLSHPGVPLSSEALVRHGWPGDKIQPEAANARLRVALSQLRTLGLRDVLRRTDEGYALSPEVRVVMDEAPDSNGTPGAAKRR